jgi:hypothetical protein
MRKSFLAVVMLFLAVKFAFAGWEMPFGLRLGVDTPETVKKVVMANGGVIKEEGNKIIKQDIVNPDIYGLKVENLNVDYLDYAMFWFYKGRLYKIEYVFPLNMEHEEFYLIDKKLRAKYGNPSRYVKPYLADGVAVWRNGDIEIKLLAPWVSWSMYLTYTHKPLESQALNSDNYYLNKTLSKPSKGL